MKGIPICMLLSMINFLSAQDSIKILRNEFGVELKWSAGYESNEMNYALERSSNGLIFTLLDVVASGSGEDNMHWYTYLDRTPEPGWNYYRIKHHFEDGTYEHSEVKAVYVHTGKSTIVYPTVIDNHINVSTNQQDIHRYQILDARGKRVQAGRLNIENTDTRISLPNYNPGVYFISLISDQNIQTFTFIKN